MEAAIVQSFNQNRNLTKIPVLAEQMLLFLQQQEAVEQEQVNSCYGINQNRNQRGANQGMHLPTLLMKY